MKPCTTSLRRSSNGTGPGTSPIALRSLAQTDRGLPVRNASRASAKPSRSSSNTAAKNPCVRSPRMRARNSSCSDEARTPSAPPAAIRVCASPGRKRAHPLAKPTDWSCRGCSPPHGIIQRTRKESLPEPLNSRPAGLNQKLVHTSPTTVSPEPSTQSSLNAAATLTLHALLVTGEICDHSIQLAAPFSHQSRRPAWLRFSQSPLSPPNPVYTFSRFPPTPLATPRIDAPGFRVWLRFTESRESQPHRNPLIPSPVYTFPCFPPTPLTTPRSDTHRPRTWLRFTQSLRS